MVIVCSVFVIDESIVLINEALAIVFKEYSPCIRTIVFEVGNDSILKIQAYDLSMVFL